jgi:hypothetical protein
MGYAVDMLHSVVMGEGDTHAHTDCKAISYVYFYFLKMRKNPDDS